MAQYNPRDWFWLSSDGRIYSSAKQAIVSADDASYLTFCLSAHPTAWPRDANGVETDAALQDVLAPYDLFVDLVSYAANRRWRKEVGGIVVAGVPVATDDRSKQMLMGARVAADASQTFQTPWVGADGAIYPLDAAQIITLSNAVLAHVAACFATFAQIKVGISAGTITTREQVDAAFASI